MSKNKPGVGHNSVRKDQLKSLVERIERLEAEKAELASDIKEVYVEAKAAGYDTKILRKAVALRRQDAAERATEREMLGIYMAALGSALE